MTELSTELVLVERSDLEALPAPERELAVTQFLEESLGALTQALEASDPDEVVRIKAELATMAEATRQLGLSRQIQLESLEMVRRAERGVAQAVLKGQEEGTVETEHDVRVRAAHTREEKAGRHHIQNNGVIKRPRASIASTLELSGAGNHQPGYLHLAEGVSEETFEVAITEAKAEENLSRANVARKIKGQSNPYQKLTGQKRIDKIRELAAQNIRAADMVKIIGNQEDLIRRLAKENDIDLIADRAMNYRRRINAATIAERTVSTLEGLASGLALFDPAQVTDHSEAEAWATSVGESMKAFRKFHRQLKEMTHDG